MVIIEKLHIAGRVRSVNVGDIWRYAAGEPLSDLKSVVDGVARLLYSE